MDGQLTASAHTELETAHRLLAERQLQAAREHFNLAERLGACEDECCGGRWLAGMLSGDFEEAWQESDAIRQRANPDPHRFWDGRPLAGRSVLLRSLHGFGDAVQFLRYVPQLVTLAKSLTVQVPPQLLLLAPYLCRGARIVTWDHLERSAMEPWDVELEVMELPYVFRTRLSDLPIMRNYLQISREKVDAVGSLLGTRTRPRVGVVCVAGQWNPARSIPFSIIRRLLRCNCDLYSLESLQTSEALREQIIDSGLVDLSRLSDGIEALAAVIAALDLVITVDTLAAHLAGAMGKPCWVLLEHAADWRWMVDRVDSPWYPSLRLFRQPRPGDWQSVVDEVASVLDDEVQKVVT